MKFTDHRPAIFYIALAEPIPIFSLNCREQIMDLWLWSHSVDPFIKKHSNAAASLKSLQTRILSANIVNPGVEIKQTISNTADYVRGSKTLWVFNIARNQYRLIGEISPNDEGVYEFTVVWIGTHAAYEQKYPG